MKQRNKEWMVCYEEGREAGRLEMIELFESVLELSKIDLGCNRKTRSKQIRNKTK